MYDETDELTLADYTAILRRRWLWALVPLVLIVSLAATMSLRQTDVYNASAKVVLAPSAAQEATTNVNQNTNYLFRDLTNEVNFAYSDSVVQQVEDNLGYLPSVSISVDSTSDTLIFAGSGTSPNDAANGANLWANTYVDAKRQQAQESINAALEQAQVRLTELRQERLDLRKDVDALRSALDREADPIQRDGLQSRIASGEAAIAADIAFIDSKIASTGRTVSDLELAIDLATTGEARIGQIASPPRSSSNAPLSRNLALGLVLGGIVGVGAALLRETLDQRLRNAEAVSRAIDIPVLASIPDPGRSSHDVELALSFQNAPGGVVADGYARLRTAFQFAAITSPTSSIVITSPNQSEGKTTTSTNLAHAMAAVGLRVVVCDLDFRRPRIHKIYGLSQEPGFSNILIDETPLGALAHSPEPKMENLALLTAGSRPPNPADFVASNEMHDVIRDLAKEADLVVIDAPPVLPVSDAISLSQHADAVLLVLNATTTKRREAEQSVRLLRGAGANIIGAVLVGVQAADGYGAYGQGYE